MCQFVPVYPGYTPSRVLAQDYNSSFLLPAVNASFQLHHKNFGDGLCRVGVASHNGSQSVREWLLCDVSCEPIGREAAPISGPSAVSLTDHGGVQGRNGLDPAGEVTSFTGSPTCSVDFLLLRQARQRKTVFQNKSRPTEVYLTRLWTCDLVGSNVKVPLSFFYRQTSQK